MCPDYNVEVGVKKTLKIAAQTGNGYENITTQPYLEFLLLSHIFGLRCADTGRKKEVFAI